MKETPYEVLIRYDKDGSIAGGHIKNLITTDTGKVYEGEQINFADFTDPAYEKVAKDFSADAVAELEALKIVKATLEKDLEAKTTEYDSTKAQYDTLVLEKAKLIADNKETTDKLVEDHAKATTDRATQVAEDRAKLVKDHTKALQDAADKYTALIENNKTVLDAKQVELTEARTLASALQARFDKLVTDLPFDPRSINAKAFYNRINKDEFAKLSASDDETLRTIAKTILAYVENSWPIVFESPEMVGMLTYLQGVGFLTEDRIKQLTQDASQSEAFVSL